ncbi:MAG: thermonuclease family protein [Hyphomicrobiaceae bacterium]
MARLWPWRRKSEGFEWHKYVRTTIAIRREQRRERAEEIKRSAQDGALRAAEGAARLGRKGAQAAGDGARRASAASRRGLQQGLMASARALERMGAASAVGARRLGAASARGLQRASAASAEGLWRARTYGGAGLRAAGRWLARASVESAAWTGGKLAALSRFAGGGIGTASRPVLDFLGRPGVAGPLMLAGAVALVSGLARPLLTGGLDREALLIISIGAICLVAGLTPRLRYGMAGAVLARAVAPLHRLPPRLGHIVAGGGTMAAAVLVAVWLWPAGLWPAGSAVSLPSMSLSSFVPFKAADPPIAGRAWAIGGDTIRIGQQSIRLDGIEAPDRDQTCLRADNRRWRCGEAAQIALSRLVAGRQVHCEPAGKGEAGIVRASCSVAGTDLAGALVEGGHVLAESGLMARYRSAQTKAQQAKAGIWSGPGAPERASEWRARLWNEARAQAPQGCPIKGKVAGRRGDVVKTYHLPWSPAYVRLRVVSARGERWFCSEAEAQAAGFAPAAIDG